MKRHPLPSSFRKNPVTVDLVGCGGTGSRLLTALAELHVGLRASGHPHGLHVTVWDPDVVSEANIGRTSFAPSDVGQSKAAVLTTRINLVFGLMWRSLCQEYTHPYWHPERTGAPPDILITATDSLRSRVGIYHQMLRAESPAPAYWMDLGNAEDTGQVIIGEPEWLMDPRQFERRFHPRLPHVVDLFPAMVETADTESPDDPSCTLAVALGQQGLFVNRHMADWGAELLWRMFRDGGLDYHGVYVNTRTGRVNPMPVPTELRSVEQAADLALPGDVSRPARRRALRSEARR